MTRPTIALIGAMQPEIELLKNSLEDRIQQQSGSFTVYSGRYAEKNVVLALSGIGKVNAALTCALVILRYRPDCVINTGSAGGVAGGMKIGDVIIGTQTAHHDADLTAFGYAYGQLPQLPPRFNSDHRLCTAAKQAAAETFHADVHTGLIVSGDRFIHSSTDIANIRKAFPDALAVEMEAAAIAQSCFQFSTPFVAIRALSDLADEKAEQSFETFLETASVRSAEMVQHLIRAY